MCEWERLRMKPWESLHKAISGWSGRPASTPGDAPSWPLILQGRQSIHSMPVCSFLELRVVIPEVSVLPEDLEELYDLFKVGDSVGWGSDRPWVRPQPRLPTCGGEGPAWACWVQRGWGGPCQPALAWRCLLSPCTNAAALGPEALSDGDASRTAQRQLPVSRGHNSDSYYTVSSYPFFPCYYFFKLKYSWFTMLSLILVYSTVIQLYTYMYFFITDYYKVLNVVSCITSCTFYS